MTARQRLVLLWGKVRRLALVTFRPGYVRRSIARRRGECLRCGACCRLGFRCVWLRRNGSTTECRFHDLRPPNCRLFPIDERDLADRDLILPHRPCGYSFAPEDQEG